MRDPRPGRASPSPATSTAALWRLLGGQRPRGRRPPSAPLLDDADDALAGRTEPLLDGLAARRSPPARPDRRATRTAAAEAVAAAREALDKLPAVGRHRAHAGLPRPRRGDRRPLRRRDAAGRRRQPARPRSPAPASPPGRCTRRTAGSRCTLSGLDLEELAVAHAVPRAPGRRRPARRRRPVADAALLSAQQHAELAQTLHRRGDAERARELAAVAIALRHRRPASWPGSPTAGRGRPARRRPGLGLTCTDELDDALGPLRRVRRPRAGRRRHLAARLHRPRARPAARPARPARRRRASTARRPSSCWSTPPAPSPPPATAAATGSACWSSARTPPTLGRPAEALHWLEAYRADTGRAHARGRELWAEMFVRRSRLREAERQAALLRRHALEDPLTGLGNRRSAERRLGALRLGEEPLSLAVVDVDRFKEVNDAASHTHGRRRPAPGRRPAARAQPHRRRGLPLGRRRVPRRAADGDRGAGRRGHGAAAGRRRRRRLERPAAPRAGHRQHRRRHRARPSTTASRPASSAGGRCSTPPTCTCSRPSAAAATGCAHPGGAPAEDATTDAGGREA